MEENKCREDSLRDDLKKAKNHTGCLINVIIVLTCIIIAMIVIWCYKKEDFSEQISFASTITSIILSVIAIIMTVVSGETLNSLLHKFRDLHDDIKEVPSKLEQTTDRFEKSCKDIESVQKDLELLPSELISTRKKVEELYNELKDTHGDIKNVDSKFEDLKSGLFRSENKQEYSKSMNPLPNEIIDNFFYMPYTAVCVLYVLFVAYKTNTAFNDKIIESAFESVHIRGFFKGVVSVLLSLNVIETKSTSITELKIDNMSQYLCSRVKNEVLSYFDSMPEALEARNKIKKETPEEFIERINNLFGYQENN